MNRILTLYLGSTPNDDIVEQRIGAWCRDQADVSLCCVSIHANPAAAVRLQFNRLPALVDGGTLIAEGLDAVQLTDAFWAMLSVHIDSATDD